MPSVGLPPAVHPCADHRAGCALMSIAVVPFGANIHFQGVDLFQICRPQHRPAGHSRHHLGRRLRHRALRLVVEQQILAAGRAARQRPGHQLRARARPLARRRRPPLRLAAAARHRRRAGDARHALLEFLRRIPVRRLLHLSHGRLRRDQSRPLRPARSGKRADRWLSHRIQLDEVRHVLHGRVRQHDHRRLRRHAALLRRMDQPLRQPAARAAHRSFFEPCFRSSGLSSRSSFSSFSTSGCAARCRASVTTS